MMGSVKSYLNYTDRKSGDPTLNPGEINHKTLKPRSKHERERLVDRVINGAYLIFVADAADIVRGEFSCHVEKS